MAKKGGVKHLKRLASPAFWAIHRKEHIWVAKPSPGPHSLRASVPLILLLREQLKLARNAFEAKTILERGAITIDGLPRRDVNFPVGLMDVVEVSPLSVAYRAIPAPGRRLSLQRIPDEEKNFKLCRIENKTTLRRGVVQLHLHDGRNIVFTPSEEGRVAPETFGTLKIDLKDGSIAEYFKFEKGSYCLVTGGKNSGRHGILTSGDDVGFARTSVVRFTSPDGVEYACSKRHTFIIGRDRPIITLAGVG